MQIKNFPTSSQEVQSEAQYGALHIKDDVENLPCSSQ